MPYMDIEEFRETQFYPKSRPSLSTVKRWIVNGEVEARKIGRKYFILVEKNKLIGNKADIVRIEKVQSLKDHISPDDVIDELLAKIV